MENSSPVYHASISTSPHILLGHTQSISTLASTCTDCFLVSLGLTGNSGELQIESIADAYMYISLYIRNYIIHISTISTCFGEEGHSSLILS